MTFVRVVLLFVCLVVPVAAAAQQPDCPTARTIVRSGSSLGSGATVSIPVDLKPCETAVVSISTATQETYGASAAAFLHNSFGQEFFQYGWQVPRSGGGQATLPLANGPAPHRAPFAGTRGARGNLATVTLKCTFRTLSSWTVTISMTPRPNYNLGGLNIDTATPVQPGVDMFGTVHHFEGSQFNTGGQYFKVRLEPGQRIFLSGFADGHSYYGGNLAIALFSPTRVYIKDLVNVAAQGRITYPNPSPKYTHTHTGATAADYYLRVYAPVYVCHDFSFRVNVEAGPAPPLTLRLRGGIGSGAIGPANGVPLPTIAYVPLGESVVFEAIASDGTAVPATFSLGATTLRPGVLADALFPANVAFRYSAASAALNSVTMQTAHLGSLSVTVTPANAAYAPQAFTLVVQEPSALGSAQSQLDALVLPLAHEFGYPPQFFKGQIDQESAPYFRATAYRYEPIGPSGDLGVISRGQNLRRTTPYSQLRLETAQDSIDPALAAGADLSADDINVRSGLKILCNATSAGRNMVAADQLISVAEIFRCNDGSQNWSSNGSAANVTLIQTDPFTAQTSLGSSYGYMQVMYVTALRYGFAPTSGQRNPSLLFDTAANHTIKGGSLRVGAEKIRRDFRRRSGPLGTMPDLVLLNPPEFLESFKKFAWKYYNLKSSYPGAVASKVGLYTPVPARSLF